MSIQTSDLALLASRMSQAGGVTSLTTTGSGAASLVAGVLNIPIPPGSAYTAGTGLTLTGTAFSVNTSQDIGTLSNLTTDGFLTASGGAGTLASSWAVVATTSAGTTGTAVSLTAGAGTYFGTNLTGGAISILGGGTIGAIGEAGTITGGLATLSGGVPTTSGSNLLIGGSAVVSGANISSYPGSGTGGAASLLGGASASTGGTAQAGSALITGGAATAGTSSSAVAFGGGVTITGGAATSSGASPLASAGSVTINGGLASGVGTLTNGSVNIGNANTAAVNIGRSGGSISLKNLTSNGLVKTSGGTGALSVATAGTDYQAPITLTTTGTSGAATLTGSTLNIPNYASGGGSGTVTSVAMTVPSFLSVSGSPITASGTLAIGLSGTALPVVNGGTGITAFGTGVATALANAVDGASGFLTYALFGANSGLATLTSGGLLTTAQLPALTGDVTGTAGSLSLTVNKINGTSLAGLATGILKNTTATGAPSIAVAGTDYQAPITLTTTGSGAATLVSNVLNIPTPSSSGGFENLVTLTAGTTSWTLPAGITTFKLRMVGGGGSGSTATVGNTNTGGGGGAYLEKYITGQTPGTVYTVAIGAGGAAVTSSASTFGNAGGNTTFIVSGTTYTAGGAPGSTNTGHGGTATNGDINLSGSRSVPNVGGTGIANALVGAGAGSVLAPGMNWNPTTAGVVGTVGVFPGGGGSSGTSTTSGAGAAGVIIIEY